MSILLLLACGGPQPEPPKPPPPVEKPAGPSFDFKAQASGLNIIFVSMDAMRFDHTGAGGGKLTPNLDAFAKEAVVFTNATSAAPWTVPSHMAMWTGLWPTNHGVVNKLKPNEKGELVFDQLKPEIKTFPEMLTGQGYTAVAFTGGAGVQSKFGYGRNFATYLDDKPFAGYEYSGPPAMAWLKENKDKHFFMFFHGYDVHGQHPLLDRDPKSVMPDYKGKFDGSIEEQAKLRESGLARIVKPGDAADGRPDITPEDAKFLFAVYDAKVQDADKRLGLFFDTVKAEGLLDKSIIVVVGDHGEEFMEHNYVDHGPTLCEHQLHVPMMIRFPGGVGARTVKDAVRTIDLYPTVFDAMGLKGPDNVDGKSLLPMLRGEKEELPIHAESDYRLFVHLRASKQGDKKVIVDLEDGKKELYDFVKDPDEKTDLSATDERTTYEMEQYTRTWLDGMHTDPNKYLGVAEEHIKLF